MNRNVSKVNLNDVFVVREKKIEDDCAAKKTIESQLTSLGHQILNKRAMLYDRNLSSNAARKFIYSDKNMPANEKTASLIIDKFILRKVNFEMYADKSGIDELKSKLNQVLVQFLNQHKTCPYRKFLHCYCKNVKNKKAIIKKVV